MAFGALLGAAAGAMSGTNGVIWAEYFGVSSIGAVKGVVNAARNGATALGAVAFAALAGHTADYTLPLISATALSGLGLLGALLLPRAHCSTDQRLEVATATVTQSS